MNVTSSNTNKITILTYNAISEGWDAKRSYYLEPLKSFLEKQSKTSFIDVGCGTGRHLKLAKELGFKDILGVDASEGQLKLAKKYASVIKQDLVSLNISETYNTVICIATLHHLLNEKDQLIGLKNIKALLSPEGKLFLTVWTPNKEYIAKYTKKNKIMKISEKVSKISFEHKNKKYDRYYYLFEEKELLNLIKKSGFEVQKTYNYKDNIIIITK